MSKPAAIGSVPKIPDSNHRLFLQALKEQVVNVAQQIASVRQTITTNSSDATGLIDALRQRIAALENEPDQPSGDALLTLAETTAIGTVMVSGGVAADIGTDAHADVVVGIAAEEGNAADQIVIKTDGELLEVATWSWTPGVVLWLGEDGALSESIGAGVFAKPVAVAITATQIMVVIGPATHATGGGDYPQAIPRTNSQGVLDETVAVPHSLNNVASGKVVLIPTEHNLIMADDLAVDGELILDGQLIEI